MIKSINSLIRLFLFCTILVFIHFSGIGQSIELKTNGYLIKLYAIDSLSYQEYSFAGLKDTTKNEDIIRMKYTYGQILKRNDQIQAQEDDESIYISPFFLNQDGTLQAPTTQIFFKPSLAKKALRKLRRFGTIEKHEFLDSFYFLYVKQKKVRNSDQNFALCKKAYKKKWVTIIEPVYVKLMKADNPLQPLQWNIKNSGQVTGATIGADMGVENAWKNATGFGVKVAVIDDGVELTHPDLQSNLLPGYDATGNNSDGGPVYYNGHGTNCAGIIAAVNNNIGTIGVAYDSKIIPIRAGIVTNGSFTATDTWIANCFFEAVNRGADVISNSWGGGAVSAQVNAAIHNAVVNGRNGKGSVVLFSTGNNNSFLLYPSILEDVIAVGASTPCDSRKRSASDPEGVSCDRQGNWGSNFGGGLDIVAPGVAIATTDNLGSNGNTSGDYNESFNGTSAACPNAAAVAALIISANSNLKGQEVREILEQTCFKSPNQIFQRNANQPNGLWNYQLGYGRVNADYAVCRAKMMCVPGNATDPNDFSFFTISGAPRPNIGYIKNSIPVGINIRTGEETQLVNIPIPARANSPFVTGGIRNYEPFYDVWVGHYNLFYIGTDNKIYSIHEDFTRCCPAPWECTVLNPNITCSTNSSLGASFASYDINMGRTLPYIFYISPDNFISVMEYVGNTWQNTDLNFGRSIRNQTPIVTQNINGTISAFYIGENDKIQRFYYDKGWRYEETHQNNTLPARANSPLAICTSIGETTGKECHVFYIGTDNRIYQQYYDEKGNWTGNCLNYGISANESSKFWILQATALPDRSFGGMQLAPQKPLRLLYQATDRSIHYLEQSGQTWLDRQLVVPLSKTPDIGTPIAYDNTYLYYRVNGSVVRTLVN